MIKRNTALTLSAGSMLPLKTAAYREDATTHRQMLEA